MSPDRPSGPPADTACWACMRRSWLLGDLSALLDYHRGDPGRLSELLGLGGEPLIGALAGSRRRSLTRTYNELEPAAVAGLLGGHGICTHAQSWPSGLAGSSERMLWLTSPPPRFVKLSSAPVLSIVGSHAVSPYGAETAGALARGLASAGVTVVAGLAGELARAAHRGAARGRGPSLAVAGDGLERIRPAGSARLALEVAREGCVVSELPAWASARGWGSVAAERTALELARVVILVEGEAQAGVTRAARAALLRGGTVGVVPGPVTSRLSTGPHELLTEGAHLIRDARDALELLYEGSPGRTIPGVHRTVAAGARSAAEGDPRARRGRRGHGGAAVPWHLGRGGRRGCARRA